MILADLIFHNYYVSCSAPLINKLSVNLDTPTLLSELWQFSTSLNNFHPDGKDWTTRKPKQTVASKFWRTFSKNGRLLLSSKERWPARDTDTRSNQIMEENAEKDSSWNVELMLDLYPQRLILTINRRNLFERFFKEFWNSHQNQKGCCPSFF